MTSSLGNPQAGRAAPAAAARRPARKPDRDDLACRRLERRAPARVGVVTTRVADYRPSVSLTGDVEARCRATYPSA